jgi:hypothetical protein
MDETRFRTLLLQSEGPDLDFKRDQYAFVGGTDAEKSKLLKDILTFANSWRLNDAYILIGIEELNTGNRNPCGISPADHIDDATLQQFVNSKTNREVKFSYEAFQYEGKSFGVITIPKQKRSLFAIKDFGIVRANEVYYRRGSSSAIASPADIYQMGLDDEKENKVVPVVRVELADLASRKVLGPSAKIQTINHEQHSRTDYPDELDDDLPYPRRLMERVNKNYWRDLADYVVIRRAFAPIAFAATNVSAELAKNVRVELLLSKDSPVMLADTLPDFPVHTSGVYSVPRMPLNSIWHRPKGEVQLLDHGDRWSLTVDFGDIQPRATGWAAESVYASASTPGIHSLSLRIYADNFSEPQDATIQLDFSIEQRALLTLDELQNVQDEYWKEKEKEFDDM